MDRNRKYPGKYTDIPIRKTTGTHGRPFCTHKTVFRRKIGLNQVFHFENPGLSIENTTVRSGGPFFQNVFFALISIYRAVHKKPSQNEIWAK